MKLLRCITYLLFVLCFSSVLAQAATCSAIVEQALSNVENDCAATARNQACYGYVSLQATPRQGVQNFSFSKVGDLVNVSDIDTLSLSRLDPSTNTWGIALMKLQANLPDTLPGQNVTFLLFGDVHIQDATAHSTSQPTIQISASSRVNIRSTPSTSGAVIGSIAAGQTATANGRNADGSWLRVQLPNSEALGWVSASVVKVSGSASSLAVIDASPAASNFTPLQAFYFQAGIGKPDCQQAPEDGILIQTPKGVGEIDLRANDVDIQLGSTAFLQAQPNGVLTISVVEGEGHVSAQGKTVDVPAGTQTTIPLDANLSAAGQPSDAQPYDAALVQPLPVQVLPLKITLAPPLTVQATPEVTAAATATAPSVPSIAYQVFYQQSNLGTICALDQPFAFRVTDDNVTATVHYAPVDANRGSWAFQASANGANFKASGSYTISAPAANGSRTLSMNGRNVATSGGQTATVPFSAQANLVPLQSACSS